MKQTFLYKVYHYNRKLFWILTLFIGLTIVFNWMGNEVTPFFVWGMYSEKMKPATHYEILKVTINESHVIDYSSGYLNNTQFFLSVPLTYYKEIKDNNGIDPTISFLKSKLKDKYNHIAPFEDALFNMHTDYQLFLPWYQRYLRQVTGTDVKSVKIEVLKAHYDQDQRIVIDSSYLLEKWPAQ